MGLIPLPCGASALVDDEDMERLSGFRWRRDLSHGYVKRGKRVNGVQTSIYLHRAVMDAQPGDGQIIDHINRDKLDNRRGNLRTLSLEDSPQNQGANRGGSSQYRGVSWNRARGKWRAQACVRGERFVLGHFEDEEVAARVAREFRSMHMPYAIEVA